MPYYRRRYRRNYRRKRYGPRRPAQTSFQKYANYAVTAYKTARYLKGLVNAEKKYHDFTLSQSPDNSTGDSQFISNIAQGDGSTQRDGNQVRCKSLQLHLQALMNPAHDTTRVRFLLIRAKSGYGTAPSYTLFMKQAKIDSFYNIDEIRNFKIVMDKTIQLTVDRPAVELHRFIKQNSVLRYDGSSGSLSNQTANQYFLYTFSDVGSDLPSISGEARIRFMDN